MISSVVFKSLLTIALAGFSTAAIFDSPGQLPGDTYDYVIVGAGTAGLVVAARLAEDPANSILVLEAGITDANELNTQIPFLAPGLTPDTRFDWNDTYTPQPSLNGRTLPIPHGRILGGSSTVNYMVHLYGSSEDYDRIARVTGDNGWSFDNIKTFMTRHEDFVPPADGHDVTGQCLPALHSTTGILPVSLPGISFPVDNRVIAATGELPEFPFDIDTITGNVLGMGFTQSAIGNGTRSSSSTTYLASVVNQPNVAVLLHAQATKLVHTGDVGGKPSFKAVEFAESPQASSNTVHARKEVILSAGTIGTPQLLQLSGIGNAAELSAKSITTLVNSPSVGKNLSDHVLLSNPFLVRGNESLDPFLRDPSLLDAPIAQWEANKTGIMVHGLTNNLGFFRFPPNSPVFQNTPTDPAAGPTAGHWEMIITNYWLVPGVNVPDEGSFMTAIAALISPTSRGNVTLASNDPFARPIINPNLIATDFDKTALRESVKAIRRFVGANAFADYVISPVNLPVDPTDDEIDAYVRTFAGTVFHPVGTSALSPADAPWGVVDPELRVKGADGLRVVDASVLPFLPNAHTQGPTYLIAERGATLIRGF